MGNVIKEGYGLKWSKTLEIWGIQSLKENGREGKGERGND